MLAQLKTEYPDDLRLVYRHFPLVSIHDKALLGTQAAEAAGRQDMFWEMYAYLYMNQSTWASLSVDEFEYWLVNTAAPSIGLDENQFESDITSENIEAYANQRH